MNSYAIYRISETIRVLLFMTLAIVVFNFYPVTAVMIVLIAVLNDFPIMMIAYDNTIVAPRPVRWDMERVLTVSSVLGVLGVIPLSAFSGSQSSPPPSAADRSESDIPEIAGAAPPPFTLRAAPELSGSGHAQWCLSLPPKQPRSSGRWPQSMDGA